MPLPPIAVDRETFLRDHFQLPPLPAVVTRVLHLVHVGRASAAEVADVLGSDPALVAQVLKIVNSAYYGLPARIGEVRHAVAYLGLAEVERLALAAAVLRFAEPGVSECYRRYWLHAFHTALVARRLAHDLLPAADGGELHAAALLHDIGKLVYMKFYPRHHEVLVARCQERGVSFREAERELDLPPHTLFGSILCDRWLMPDAIRRAAERHEIDDLPRLGDDEQLLVVTASNLMANLATENLAEPRGTRIREAVSGALGVDHPHFLTLMGTVYELRNEAEAFLQTL